MPLTHIVDAVAAWLSNGGIDMAQGKTPSKPEEGDRKSSGATGSASKGDNAKSLTAPGSGSKGDNSKTARGGADDQRPKSR